MRSFQRESDKQKSRGVDEFTVFKEQWEDSVPGASEHKLGPLRDGFQEGDRGPIIQGLVGP